MKYNDTIVAISTAFGNAGIAIVRTSGDKSLAILKKVFKSQNKRIQKPESHKLYYGQIISKKGKTIDEALVCYFKKPKSYTKEDTIEIHCHGGFVTANKILERVLEEGARIARPGEFTERAFFKRPA
jgi:tRNA modification GTPase